jgi:hypothetical protein
MGGGSSDLWGFLNGGAVQLFQDLKDARLMYLKAVLFGVAGLLAGGALLAESPSLRTAFLLAVVIGSFCRLYYFCFYVIEKYIDPDYRFAGLGSLITYLLRRKRAAPPP